MTKKEAAKLLELIKLSYPHAYRDMDDDWKLATINMWYMSFPDVPYPIMEQAFNHFRMVSKFPPTVAEMGLELKRIYQEATTCALIHKSIGDEDLASRYREVMEYTKRYRNESELGGLNIEALPRLGGGRGEAVAGSSRNRMRNEDGLSLLDAGE